MTDDLSLFRGPLRTITGMSVNRADATLRVRGAGEVKIHTKRGAITLSNVLYVPGLRVNLISGSSLCNTGMLGSFDKNVLYIRGKNGNVTLKAIRHGGLYVVKEVNLSVTHVYSTRVMSAYTAQTQTAEDIINHSQEENLIDLSQQAQPQTDLSKNQPEKETPESVIEQYRLWHRRFAYMNEKKLQDLHKITTLQKAINKSKGTEICEVCALANIYNRTNTQLAERKQNLLDLVSIDICGPLPTALTGAKYFLEMVNNHTRKS
jgi:GAG-pre-integrase domain